LIASVKELDERSTRERTMVKRITAKMPERTGEMTHERTMPTMPPGMYSLSSPDSLYQTTQPEPLVTMAMPTRPPHTEWVVETGISRAEASSSQRPMAPTTHRLPYMRRAASMYEST
jgi:hypothetical protein